MFGQFYTTLPVATCSITMYVHLFTLQANYCVSLYFLYVMRSNIHEFCSHTRLGGNQRELARQKNAKKQAGKGKGAAEQGANKGASLEQRKHRYMYM